MIERSTTMLRQRTRAAFSLVEMLVALALTMFIVLILTQAFVTSLEAFSGLKSIGTMQANLRTVASILQADLQADHFEGKRRLSDSDLPPHRPGQGFVFIYQGSAPNLAPALTDPAPNVIEGWDNSVGAPPLPLPPQSSWPSPNFFSCRANHVLGMTVKPRGNRPEDVFSALVPPNSPLLSPSSNYFNQSTASLFQNQTGTNQLFNSQWAETYYFLVQTGSTDNLSSVSHGQSGTPLHALYRAQLLLVPNPVNANNNNQETSYINYPNLSGNINGGKLVFNAPEDVANPNKRSLLMTSNYSYPVRAGEMVSPPLPPSGATLLQSNVVSFQVQVFKPGDTEFQDPGYVGDPYPRDFDTATASYNVVAIKITIRIYDPDTKQSRQISIVQDM